MNVIVTVIILFLVFFGPIIASLIIWFSTKDPSNKWLKRLYNVRLVMGWLTLISIIKVLIDAANHSSAASYGNEVAITITVRVIIAWLLMTRWVKAEGLNQDKTQ